MKVHSQLVFSFGVMEIKVCNSGTYCDGFPDDVLILVVSERATVWHGPGSSWEAGSGPGFPDGQSLTRSVILECFFSRR